MFTFFRNDRVTTALEQVGEDSRYVTMFLQVHGGRRHTQVPSFQGAMATSIRNVAPCRYKATSTKMDEERPKFTVFKALRHQLVKFTK